MFLRALAVVSGIVLVAAAVYASLAHVEAGFTSPYGVITLAVAGGLIVGALCVGAAWSVGRPAIALAIAFSMMCGELYALILTGERIVSTREAAQVLIRDAVELRGTAARRVDMAEAALASTHRSDRLERALAAKAAADRAVVDKSAERGCASHCRALLQAQVDAAQRDVDAALAEQQAARERAGRVLEAARAVLAAIRLPPNSSPLAARLGLPAWVLDLAVSGLASLAINGLGAALLAFGAHGRGRDPEPSALAAASADTPAVPKVPKQKLIATPLNGLAHVAKFAVEVMQPDPEGAAPARQIRSAYLRWCSERGHDALPARDMPDRLAALCDKAGLEVDANDGNPVIRGIKLVA